MEIIILQAQGSSQLIIFKLKMGARDSSFINKVSYLAKWIIQSITTIIISKVMHSFSIQRFMQKSVLNASRSLTIKVHTTHRVMANDCLHNLLVKQTNNFTNAPNSCSFYSNYHILIQSTWSNIAIHSSHAIDQFQNHSQTQKFQTKTIHCIYKCNLF